MAEAVGSVRVDLFTNLAEWSAGLNKAEGQLNRFAKGVEKTSKTIEKTGTTLTRNLTLPLAAFGGFAIKAASDAQDLQGVFNISFGSMSDEANAWAKSTGDALGRSTQTMQKAGIAFQQLFEDIAPTEKAAGELSMRFAELSADFSAFANVSDEQAQKVLIGGLTGAGKALKKLGIDVGDAATKQRAFELGIARVGTELTEQQKTLARATIIMDGFGKAQGEIARSQDDTEEKTRRTREEFNELLVTVGDQLLPAFNSFLQGVSDVIAQFNALDASTQRLVIGLAAGAAAAGPLLIAFGSLGKFAAGAAKVIGSAIGVLAGFGKASKTAAGDATQLGLSVKGAIGWFAALAPVAYEAGKAVGTALGGGGKEWKASILTAVEAKFREIGLSAKEAATAQRLFAEAADKGEKVDLKTLATKAKLVTAREEERKALRKAVDAGIEEVAAAHEAQVAEEERNKALKELIKSFGDLTNVVADAEELQAIRDKVDPINAALRDYNEQMTLARQAGVDMSAAQRVLGKEFVASITGVEGWRDSVKSLPEPIRALIEEMDDLAGRVTGIFNVTDDLDLDALGIASLDLGSGFADAVIAPFEDARDMMLSFDPAARFEDQMDRIERAWATGTLSAEAYERAKADAFADTPEGQRQLQMFDDITDGLLDAATGAQKFGDMVKNLVKEFIKTDILKPIIQNNLKGLFPQVAGVAQAPGVGAGGFDVMGALGSAAGAIGGLFGFGGTRDKGGWSIPGMTYRIGAGVEETFTPAVPGTVNRGPGNPGSSGATVVFNVNANDPNAFRASKRQMTRDARRELGAL